MWGVPPEHPGARLCNRGCARRAREFAYSELGWSTLISFIDPANAAFVARCGAPRRGP